MSNIMTIRAKQHPFLFFFQNLFSFRTGDCIRGRYVCFAIHSFVMMMKSKRSNRKIIGTTIKTFISKFQNKFGFKHSSIDSSVLCMFLSFYRHTRFAVSIKSKSITMVFRKAFNWFNSLTASTPFVSLTINYWFHDNSISYPLTVINPV